LSEGSDGTAEVLRRLSNIERKVESIDETNAFAMRSNREAHQQQIEGIFGKSRRRAQVYLAANGKRSVGDIASLLGMKQPNVSSDLTLLEKEGLLNVFSSAGFNHWNKKPIDWALGVSELLMQKFKLDQNGTPVG
jgi:DNA-binding transcriptional ArsR family regulator